MRSSNTMSADKVPIGMVQGGSVGHPSQAPSSMETGGRRNAPSGASTPFMIHDPGVESSLYGSDIGAHPLPADASPFRRPGPPKW